MVVAEREAKLLDPVRDFLKEPKKLLIGGEWTDAASGATFATIDPATDQPLAEVPLAGAEDVDRAVAAAREAFDDGRWSEIDPRKRAKVLFVIADAIEEHAATIGQIDTLDNGKPVGFAMAEAAHAAMVFRYYAGWADKVYGETNPTDPSAFVYTIREPLGVCGQVIPWNFPTPMLAWKVAPALAFGNCSILKPAEETPLSALFIAKLCQEAGVPDGVLNVLTGDGETTGAPLVAHTGIDKIAFTGSTEVGRKIVAASSGNLARVTLELGGKSPAIVFPDADVPGAVQGASFGIFWNTGQVCTAGSRLLVQHDMHDEFVGALQGAAESWAVGDGLDEGTMVGPLVSRQQLERVTGYLEIGKSEGAEVRTGGERVAGTDGYFVQPTIFTGVKPDMRIAQEEIFGPVLSVLTFDDVDEAIRIANDTMYGLHATVWTKDLSTAHRVARGVRAGMIGVNLHPTNDPGVSFGGYKASGYGRELGPHSLNTYTQTKSVWVKL